MLDKKQAELWDAYVAGFNQSGEGYNGEYPFGDKGVTAESDEDLKKAFKDYLKNRNK